MKLGLVTYQLAKDWNVQTIVENCVESGFTGVELRTTHAHGVEVGLSASQRTEVRRQFEDSPVTLVGLGSAFEYDAVDGDELRQNIEGTKVYTRLAADVGASGVKVRPNKVHVEEGVPMEQTLEQIGLSLRECGAFAEDLGIEIRLEVHGRVTCEVPNIRTILDHAQHDNVFACWNSNQQDVVDGSIDANFDLLASDIRLVHITELWSDYPWRRLFELLKSTSYEAYTLAEVPESADPIRFMRYYRALWQALGGE